MISYSPLTYISIVMKLASPPIRFEIGSAANTPFACGVKMFGRRMVKGMTSMTFLNIEKKIDLPRIDSALYAV